MAKKVKKKQKQQQKQKQSQRTSVTVNINTKSKSKSKRKAPRATNGNTNRVLQQFAQPNITLPNNLINPPPMPQYGLNPSQLQTRRNDGEAVSMGQGLGQPVSTGETLRAGFPVPTPLYATPNNPLQYRQDPYEQSLSGFSLGADSLRNYDEPEKAYTASLSSGFSVGTSAPPSTLSSSGLSGSSLEFPSDLSSLSSVPTSSSSIQFDLPSRASTPVRNTYYNLPTSPTPTVKKTRVKLRLNQPSTIGGLSAEPPQSVGVPKAGNPSLSMLPQRPETTRMFNESIPSVQGNLGDY